MSELRAPRRTERMRAPIKDRSGERLQWILVGLVSVLFAAVILNAAKQSERNNRPQIASTVQPQTSAPPVEALAQNRQPIYRAQQPQSAPAYTGPTPEQIRRYNAMQENCYRVTRMNSDGEYPALQASACNDYARYASSIGLQAGALPSVRVAQAERPAPRYEQHTSNTKKPPGECAYLEESRQNIHKITRQALHWQQTEYYRERLRQIDAQMWDLNCRNH